MPDRSARAVIFVFPGIPRQRLARCADGFKRAGCLATALSNTCNFTLLLIRVSASRSAFSRHVMSSVRLMGYSSEAASEISLPHPPSGHRPRDFWKRYCTEFGDKKPTTLPASAQGQAVPARRLPARSASVPSWRQHFNQCIDFGVCDRSQTDTRSVPALGFISVTCSITCSPV